MKKTLLELADIIKGSRAVETQIAHDELMVLCDVDNLIAVITFLKTDENCEFSQMMNICGADYPARPKRFDVVYNLLSPTLNQRVRVKVMTDEATPVPSITLLYPTAGWFERETWDMYGVYFSDNPDLRRILTDYGFDGHPLRKDFPLTGYVELRYDPEQKRVAYSPVKLPQAFRTFDFMSPWEGGEYLIPEAAPAPAAPPAEKKAG